MPSRAGTRRFGGLAVQMVVTVGFAMGTAASPADEVAVMPYRPTVSTPAALSAIDWVEVETGLLDAGGGTVPRRDSAPYTIKLALSDDWGIRIGGEFWVRDIGADGRNFNGDGDTSAVLKRRFAVNEHSAFGLEAGVNMPTAQYGLHSGSGATDYGLKRFTAPTSARLITPTSISG